MPIVIWKSEKPRCFKGVNVPVQYFNQKKAWIKRKQWMTGEIMDAKLNRQLNIDST